MTSKRNPYHRPIDARWWRALPFYRFYMLRESTAIPALWFSIELLVGLFALSHGAESWGEFVAFLQHPVTLLLNVLTLAAAVLHSKTWLDLAPKASIIIVKGEKLPPAPLILGLQLVTIVISIVILIVALRA